MVPSGHRGRIHIVRMCSVRIRDCIEIDHCVILYMRSTKSLAYRILYEYLVYGMTLAQLEKIVLAFNDARMFIHL